MSVFAAYQQDDIAAAAGPLPATFRELLAGLARTIAL
jgi:hypothetical protein